MEAITITRSDDFGCGWTVTQGDKRAKDLTFEEMLGVVVGLTTKEVGEVRCLGWMKTKKQAELEEAWLKGIKERRSQDEHGWNQPTDGNGVSAEVKETA